MHDSVTSLARLSRTEMAEVLTNPVILRDTQCDIYRLFQKKNCTKFTHLNLATIPYVTESCSFQRKNIQKEIVYTTKASV